MKVSEFLKSLRFETRIIFRSEKRVSERGKINYEMIMKTSSKLKGVELVANYYIENWWIEDNELIIVISENPPIEDTEGEGNGEENV